MAAHGKAYATSTSTSKTGGLAVMQSYSVEHPERAEDRRNPAAGAEVHPFNCGLME